MIEINLLPGEFRKKEAIKLVLPEGPIKKGLWFLFAVFLVGQILFTVWAVSQGFEVKRLRVQIAALKLQNRLVLQKKAETTLFMKRMEQIRTMTQRKFHWSLLLNAVSDSMTKGVWLQSLSAASPPAPKHVLKLEGSVVSPGQETAFIGRFIKELKDNSYLGNLLESVELSNINQRKIRDYDVYDFTLSCAFKKDKNP